jgi:hypothetical protein
MAEFSLTSAAFAVGGTIPRRHSCDGEDRSPPLSWAAPPPGSRSLALILDDPDAPGGRFVHWPPPAPPPAGCWIDGAVDRAFLVDLTDGVNQPAAFDAEPAPADSLTENRRGGSLPLSSWQASWRHLLAPDHECECWTRTSLQSSHGSSFKRQSLSGRSGSAYSPHHRSSKLDRCSPGPYGGCCALDRFGSAAPWRTALLGQLRVGRRANGEASSVMARRGAARRDLERRAAESKVAGRVLARA